VPDENPDATTEGETLAEPAAPYVQLVAAWAANERQASAALVTPDANGRLPVVVRVGGPGVVRWEPVAGAIGLVVINLVFSPPPIFYVALLLLAGLLVVLSLVGRLFIRVPEGAWGLIATRNRYEKTFLPGAYTVLPTLVLTHLVARRDIVFDAPVAAAPSSDGVRVNVDALVTFRVVDPAKFAFQVSVSDFDQFLQAAIQDTVRSMVRGMTAYGALDLGADQATKLKAALGKLTGPFGVEISAVTFTRSTLPVDIAASLEAQRMAAIQQDVESATFALEQTRISNHAALETMEQVGRIGALEKQAEAEDLRLRLLEQRLRAHPAAARYDLQVARLKVAKKLASNTRAVVGLGGPGAFTTATLLAGGAESADDPEPTAPAPPAAKRAPRSRTPSA
jgi:regulator of protease activity HflC (stomatin/prohibitin superfamily)